jgi:hypothetical protein
MKTTKTIVSDKSRKTTRHTFGHGVELNRRITQSGAPGRLQVDPSGYSFTPENMSRQEKRNYDAAVRRFSGSPENQWSGDSTAETPDLIELVEEVDTIEQMRIINGKIRDIAVDHEKNFGVDIDVTADNVNTVIKLQKSLVKHKNTQDSILVEGLIEEINGINHQRKLKKENQ